MIQDPAVPPGFESSPKVWTEGQFEWLRIQHGRAIMELRSELDDLRRNKDAQIANLVQQYEQASREMTRLSEYEVHPWRAAIRITWRKLTGR